MPDRDEPAQGATRDGASPPMGGDKRAASCDPASYKNRSCELRLGQELGAELRAANFYQFSWSCKKIAAAIRAGAAQSKFDFFIKI